MRKFSGKEERSPEYVWMWQKDWKKMGIEKGIEIGRSEGEIKGKMLVYKNLCKGRI